MRIVSRLFTRRSSTLIVPRANVEAALRAYREVGSWDAVARGLTREQAIDDRKRKIASFKKWQEANRKYRP